MDSLSQMHLSQKKTKRLSEEELQALWAEYFTDRTNKKVKDTLIVQYIYFFLYNNSYKGRQPRAGAFARECHQEPGSFNITTL